MYARIAGTGSYLPQKILTNAELETLVDTSDEWIRTRTGIRERHVVDKGMASSHLATEAAKQVLANTNTDPAEIDMIIVATITPDVTLPSRVSSQAPTARPTATSSRTAGT